MSPADASLGAALFAVDPAGAGGVCLRSLPQPARAQWLELLRNLLPPAVPLRRIPFNIADGRLLGGLDLTATLKANRPVAERGVLASLDGGVAIVTMAERLTPHTSACLTAVLDSGVIAVERDGVCIEDRARVALVALDEAMAEDEGIPNALRDRLAFLVDLNGFDPRTPLPATYTAAQVEAARHLLSQVQIASDLVEALCETALALAAGSVRASLLAVRVARAAAALRGQTSVSCEDLVTAGRLVLAPRATRVPAERDDHADGREENQTEPTGPGASGDAAPHAEGAAPRDHPGSDPATRPAQRPEDGQDPDRRRSDGAEAADRGLDGEQNLGGRVLAATRAAIPHGLLENLRGGPATGRVPAGGGRAGVLRTGGVRGRPSGISSGAPRDRARLNVMETLRAAAPWQRLRGRMGPGHGRVRIEAGDFRTTRYRQRSQSLTIFAVDASGSSALHRLAEAKGAVELLLADCYVRRDQVAVITFRGRTAQLLLPPTRSLVRAKRSLAGLPGGGGTPLAAAISSATLVACHALRRGDTPIVVLLTDGRANVARSGAPGREAAQADALLAARQLHRSRIAALLVDTSPRPNPLAAALASAMNAPYVPLPFANAQLLSGAVAAAGSAIAPRRAR